jgi:hypothetical protein
VLCGHGALDVGRGHGHVLVVRTAEAHGRRHLVPAMACLAGKVGDLVHRSSRARRNERVAKCQMDVEAGAALKQALGAVEFRESCQYRHPESPPLS